MNLIMYKCIFISVLILFLLLIKLNCLVSFQKGFFRKLICVFILYFILSSLYDLPDKFLYSQINFSSILGFFVSLFCEIYSFIFISNITLINKFLVIYKGHFYFKKDINISDDVVVLSTNYDFIKIDISKLT